jgi:hypothetical protein
MAFDAGLAERLRDFFHGYPGITEKKMFGGLAFLLNGNLLVGILGETLMARVGAANYNNALCQAHVRVMDFSGKPMRGYVFVDPEGLESDQEMSLWLQLCTDFVSTLPPKIKALPRRR